MESKHGYLLVVVLGVLVFVGLASAASVHSSPSLSPSPSGGHFVNTPPAYDSAWQAINPGGTVTFTHNLGGLNTDKYVVDLMFLRSEGAHHLSYGTDEITSTRKGAFWHNLTTAQIGVTRRNEDSDVSEVRLRIWVVPEADYDSDWMQISASGSITPTHRLGGDTDDYLVYMEANDTDTGGEGVNHLFYGMDGNRPNGAPRWYGFYWGRLTTSQIRVYRGSHDWSADEVRVRIWRVPPAQYDSGWFSIGQGANEVLTHGWGGPRNDLFVDLQFKYTADGEGINQRGYGLVTVPAIPPHYPYGATWQDLSGGLITVTRALIDPFLDEVRLRIWASHRFCFPLALRNY